MESTTIVLVILINAFYKTHENFLSKCFCKTRMEVKWKALKKVGNKLTKLIVVRQWVEDMEIGPSNYLLKPKFSSPSIKSWG
jgi:hypothetical protein